VAAAVARPAAAAAVCSAVAGVNALAGRSVAASHRRRPYFYLVRPPVCHYYYYYYYYYWGVVEFASCLVMPFFLFPFSTTANGGITQVYQLVSTWGIPPCRLRLVVQ
jgi:hypothetical protein